MQGKFTIVKKGYDRDEVERYIEGLEAVIKGYKDKDTAIKNAIVNAQIAADNIVNEAEQRSSNVYKGAVDKLNSINDSLSEQKRIVSEFQDAYNAIINRYVHKFNEQDIGTLLSKIGELESFLKNLGDINSLFGEGL